MRRFFALLILAVTLRCYGQWAENKHSEEMTGDERDTLYAKKKTAREADAAVDQWRNQIRYNHGQSDHRDVELFEADGYVVITDKESH